MGKFATLYSNCKTASFVRTATLALLLRNVQGFLLFSSLIPLLIIDKMWDWSVQGLAEVENLLMRRSFLEVGTRILIKFAIEIQNWLLNSFYCVNVFVWSILCSRVSVFSVKLRKTIWKPLWMCWWLLIYGV